MISSHPLTISNGILFVLLPQRKTDFEGCQDGTVEEIESGESEAGCKLKETIVRTIVRASDLFIFHRAPQWRRLAAPRGLSAFTGRFCFVRRMTLC
jgi:hypothetical protein